MSSPNMDPGAVIEQAMGKIGRYQIWIITILFFSRVSVNQHQVLIVLVSPPAGNFTCSDTNLDQCDEKCPSHKFDHSIWENTIDYEWDLVCSKAYIKSMVQSIIMSGVLFSNVTFGFLADRYGRHLPMVAAMILLVVTSTASAFAPWLWLYVILRFLSTFGLGGTMFPLFSLLMEFTRLVSTSVSHSKYRTIVGICFTIPCALGHASLGLIGYLCRRWDHIQLIVSVPVAVLISYWCLLPESPRWLLMVGRGEEVIQVFEKGARCNKQPTEHIRPLVEQFINQRKGEPPVKGGNIVDLFRTRRMATKSLTLFLNWAIVAMNYFGEVQYIGQISGNIFINIATAGLAQIPGMLIGAGLIYVIGRKWSMIVSYSITVVPMIIIAFISGSSTVAVSLMACIAILGTAMSFSLIYVYSSELFPTMIRALGVGLCSMCARFGSMISPFVILTADLIHWMPPLIFGICPAVAALTVFFFLPDTSNIHLPTTVEEADQI